MTNRVYTVFHIDRSKMGTGVIFVGAFSDKDVAYSLKKGNRGYMVVETDIDVFKDWPIYAEYAYDW